MNHPFSIIVPTYKEAENIPDLITRIANINFKDKTYEAIIVDDNSQDGTYEIVTELAKKHSWLKIMVRTNRKGLSESILDGIKQAKYPLYVIMDADLSHPPEKLQEMLTALSSADLVIGSRYVRGGSLDHSWPRARRLVSKIAMLLAQCVIALPVKDPLSGFLAFRRELIEGYPLNPIGWKMGLEIMVKCPCKKIREIPIHFSSRHQGASKLSFMTALHYIQHLTALLFYKYISRRK